MRRINFLDPGLSPITPSGILCLTLDSENIADDDPQADYVPVDGFLCE
jgi:hypothetical protein